MHDILQPYLNDIANAIVGLLAALFVAAFIKLRLKVQAYIVSHTTAAQRDLLHSVASEAVAYAGTVFKDENGPERLQNAIAYVNAHLKQYGVSFNEVELRGAVEKAYAVYKAQSPDSKVVTTVQGDNQKAAEAVDAIKNQVQVSI